MSVAGVTLTSIVNMGAATLLCAALYRRPQAINVTLATGYVLAIALAQSIHGGDLRALLVVLDAGVVVYMSALYGLYHSDRAKIVGAVGMVKVTGSVAAAVFGWPWGSWAAANNALFYAQILIAGGMADGIMAWLGNLTLRAARIFARVPAHDRRR